MRALRRMLAALGATILLTGCTGSPEAPEVTATPSASTSTQPKVLIWADPIHVSALTSMATRYEAAHNVRVLIQPIDLDQTQTQLLDKAPQGLGPDLFIGANEWVGDLVKSGMLAPVDLGENKKGLSPLSIASFTLAGDTYGLPFAADNVALLRNTALAPAAPKSIEALVSTGMALKAVGKVSLPLALPVGDYGGPEHWFPLYSASGGYIFGQEADGSYNTTDLGIGMPGSVEAGKALAELTRKGVVSVKVDAGKAATDFNKGRAAFLIGGPENVVAAQEAGIAVAVDPMPGYASSPESQSQALVGFRGFMLSAFAANKSAAMALLTDELMTTQMMDSLYQAAPREPAWLASMAKVRADPAIAGFAVFAAGSVPTPNVADMPVVWRELGAAQVKIMKGADPIKAMAAARKHILAALSTN